MLKTLSGISFLKKMDGVVIVGLLLLSSIPIVAGMVRMGQVFNGAMTAENARFHLSPIPVVMHIIAATIYSVLGAFQFSPGFRAGFSHLHRPFGKVLIVSGFVVALTGTWMTLFYPAANSDGLVVSYVRLIVGIAMTMCLGFGIDSIRKRKFTEHGRWMIRAYALGLGAGTQVLTHIPWFLYPQIQGEAARALFMTLGWVINVAVAEWIIQKTIIT